MRIVFPECTFNKTPNGWLLSSIKKNYTSKEWLLLKLHEIVKDHATVEFNDDMYVVLKPYSEDDLNMLILENGE